MSLEFPIQNRAIDPYASYNSNVVNILTRMITRGKNCLHGVHAIDVVIDATCGPTEITVLPGECFKDDVLIQILESHTVDMTLSDYYINHNNPWTEAGYYYVCLEYIYQKAKPAPVAKLRLLKPSQRNLYNEDTSPFLLLKVAEVVFNGSTFEVARLFDYDPSYPDNKRVYSQLYAGVEDTLPLFEKMRDEGRLIYVHDRDEMFFGIDNRWESFNSVRANINTTNVSEGDVVYINEYGEASLAIATSSDTLANGIVLYSGNTDGKIRLFGEFQGAKIEPGISISIGDHIYLSSNTPGTITNYMPSQFSQYLGIAISGSTIDNKCDIIFMPGGSGFGDGNGFLDFYQDLLHSSVFEYMFVEPFGNNDFIDSTASNLQVDPSTYTLKGGMTGDVYQTISLQEPSFNTRMNIAQITGKYECDGNSFIRWYISNNGSDPLDWEVAELDKLHNFSTYRLETIDSTGVFIVGEDVLSITSNKMATINGINGNYILVYGDTRTGVDYDLNEIIIGQTSGAIATIQNFVNRQDVSYHDLRVRIEFDGTSSDCQIFDYCVLYDQDEDIFNKFPTESDLQANIDTLYFDIYRYPSQDDDGNPNLTIPIEVQIQNLRDFIDASCCMRIDQLENELDTQELDLTGLENRVTTLESDVSNNTTDISNLSTQITNLNNQISVIDNDIDTLFVDIYHSPSRDGDGQPNRTESIEDSLADLQNQINNITVAPTVRTAMYVTTADTSPDVGSYPSIVRIDYNAPLTITNFDNGVVGQELIIVFTNDNTTIQSSANIYLMGAADFHSQNRYVLTLVHNGYGWVEMSRSVNTYSN